MRVISSFCSWLITRFPVKRKCAHGGEIVEGEKDRLAVSAMAVAGPRGHAEDVLLFPLEALVPTLGTPPTGSDLVDHASGVADEIGSALDQLKACAHGRHHRPAGERVAI